MLRYGPPCAHYSSIEKAASMGDVGALLLRLCAGAAGRAGGPDGLPDVAAQQMNEAALEVAKLAGVEPKKPTPPQVTQRLLSALWPARTQAGL